MSRLPMIFALAAACANGDDGADPWDPADPPRANMVVVVLDEIGTDKIGAYEEHPDPPATPNIDALAADGMLFRNAWAYPTCTPTRVALMTGEHPRVWGSHRWVHPDEDWELPPSALSVPELLELDPTTSWDASFTGKWHLTGFASDAPAEHPRLHGWPWFAGSPGNLDKFIGDEERGPGNYYDWQKNDNGTLAWTQRYATTDTVDDAIARMEVMEPPWVLYVSLNASHVPWNPPPAALATVPLNASDADRHDTIVEAMDTELGRLFAAAPADATVVLLGDNGTLRGAIEEPRNPSHSKTTLFEGGVNVPLIVSGSLVPAPGESAALVHVLDVFATLADNAGVAPADLPHPVHGRSLLPLLDDPAAPGSDLLFAAVADENGNHPEGYCEAVRDRRFKVIRCDGGAVQLYDLRGRDDDGPNLARGLLDADQRERRRQLVQALDAWRESAQYRGP